MKLETLWPFWEQSNLFVKFLVFYSLESLPVGLFIYALENLSGSDRPPPSSSWTYTVNISNLFPTPAITSISFNSGLFGI